MNESREIQDKLQLQFVSLLLHDLETPIAVSKHFLNRVVEGRYDPNNPAHQSLAQSTLSAIHRAERILEDVLDQARNEGSQLSVNKSEVNFKELIEACISVVLPLLQDKEITLEKQIDSALSSPFFLDELLTTRVIDNYLVNAIRHTPRKSAIHLIAQRDEEGLFFELRNPGMVDENMDIGDIFRPEKQVELRQQRKMLGNGLGLSFCRIAIEAQGGTVGARNRASNEVGFWFQIPLCERSDIHG